MTVHAIADGALGNTSYLVEVGGREAVVVDAPRDVRPHLELAGRLNLRVVAALDTHLHADFVGGARELASAVGAEVVAARDADVAYPHRPTAPDDVIGYGGSEIRVVATPGHTPEHVAYLLRTADRPDAVFTGGSVTAGGAARTDLVHPSRTEELARAQFASFRTIAALPDDTAVHPTHGGGSFCSVGPSGPAGSTLRELRATNPLLSLDDEDRFVEELLAGYGSFPPYFLRLREVNRRGAPIVANLADPPVLEPARVSALVDEGVPLVDARGAAAWTQAHPVGSIAIPVDGAFATWLGWVVEFGRPFVVLADPGERQRVLWESRRIGYDDIVGWLDSLDAWSVAGLPVASSQRIDPREAARRVEDGWTLLDVRQRSEHEADAIPAAVHLELGSLAAGRIPDAARVVTHCGHGERAVTAASLLERAGKHVVSMPGGPQAWRRSGLDRAS